MAIFLIAGHHDKDPGAISGTRIEAVETKKARVLIDEFIPKNKYRVILDRDNETNRELQARIKPGDGSVLLDIHFNSASSLATGVECLVNAKDWKDKDSLAYKMADEINKATADILEIPDRGVKPETGTRHGKLGILNQGAGCGVLWEICFISNPLNMQKWDLKQKELCKKIAEILQKYDDVK